MRTLIAALMLAAAPAFAQSAAPVNSLTNASSVKEVVPYYLWCSSTTIGTTVSDITGNTNVVSTTGGVYKLIVQNLSSSATEYFSSDFGVTTATAPRTGFALYPMNSSNPALPNWITFPISIFQQFFGIAGTNGSPLQVCKQR